MEATRSKVPPRRQPADDEVELTPEELSAILQEASRLQESRSTSAHVTTLADAYETAREIGIAPEHVDAAAEKLRRLRTIHSRASARAARRRRSFINFAWITLLVCLGVLFLRGLGPARMVLLGMSIPLLILGFQWVRSEYHRRNPEVSRETPHAGECRVCGAPAWQKKATFCSQHRPG
jgi:Flp pilus assembly protein TadB